MMPAFPITLSEREQLLFIARNTSNKNQIHHINRFLLCVWQTVDNEGTNRIPGTERYDVTSIV